MIYTESFCIRCLCKVSLNDGSPESRTFLDASRPSQRNEVVLGEDGVCFTCGKKGRVVYFKIGSPFAPC